MGSEDQALTVRSKSHSKSSKGKSRGFRGKQFHKSNRDASRIICYTCDEVGQYAKDCPNKQKKLKKSGKRRHHAHAAEDDEPSRKKSRYESEESSSEDEYVLI